MKAKKFSQLEFEERKFSGKVVYGKNVLFGEKELNCKGSKFQIVIFKPGHDVGAHYHKKTSEIFFVHKGRGLLKLNGKGFRCEAGDSFLCEPGDAHEFENDSCEDFVILVFKTNEAEGDIYWD